MNELLSDNTFQILVHLRANYKISWLWAKRTYNNETNTLLQSKILKSKGRPHNAIIKPTQKGSKIIKNIMSHGLAQRYMYLKRVHSYVVIACWLMIILSLIILGYNRWWIVRTAPVSLIFALGAVWFCCVFFVPIDWRLFALQHKVQKENSISKLKHLTRYNHIYWNRNMDYYLIDLK